LFREVIAIKFEKIKVISAMVVLLVVRNSSSMHEG